MKSKPPLSLEQLYPPACDGVSLNTCHDPDCGNHGVDADFSAERILGPNAKARLEKTRSNSGAVGLGKYHLDSNKRERRISTAFEYTGDPHTWKDRRKLECQFDGGSGPCGAHFELWSNEHVVAEIKRLRSQNGIFTGPVCGACGRA